jgi:hypothetical protein
VHETKAGNQSNKTSRPLFYQVFSENLQSGEIARPSWTWNTMDWLKRVPNKIHIDAVSVPQGTLLILGASLDNIENPTLKTALVAVSVVTTSLHTVMKVTECMCYKKPF